MLLCRCGIEFEPRRVTQVHCSSTCRKRHSGKRNADRRKKARAIYRLNPIHYVYYLPEEHYVGMTINIEDRMQHHSKRGKIIEDYEILGKFERGVDAHLLETLFHIRGYHGNGLRIQ